MMVPSPAKLAYRVSEVCNLAGVTPTPWRPRARLRPSERAEGVQ